MYLCVQLIRTPEAAACRRQKTLPSLGLSRHVRSFAAKRKRCVHLSRGDKSFWGRVSFWRQQAPLFRHFLISVHVRGLLGNRYFCIYLFIYFYVIVFFFHLLFSPYILYILKFLVFFNSRNKKKSRSQVGAISMLLHSHHSVFRQKLLVEIVSRLAPFFFFIVDKLYEVWTKLRCGQSDSYK